uniref:Metalloendopeptidase n=1 Tax=Poecilia mexicana TaxID=48701 RepID=A0A3B3XG20_9TELE
MQGTVKHRHILHQHLQEEEKKKDLKARASLLLLLLSAVGNAYPADVRNHAKYRMDAFSHHHCRIVQKHESIFFFLADLCMNCNTFLLTGSAGMLLEGDVYIPTTRTAMKSLNNQGIVEIPFVISDEYGGTDNTEKSKILLPIKCFEGKTFQCLSSFVFFFLFHFPSCFSLLGCIGDKQVASLQTLGCVHHGIVQHEPLHTLGFYHKHTRSNRDQFVKIHWENIKECKKKNLLFERWTQIISPRIDDSSGALTFMPVPDPNVPIGQRSGLSDIDILRVNELYKCRSDSG